MDVTELFSRNVYPFTLNTLIESHCRFEQMIVSHHLNPTALRIVRAILSAIGLKIL